MKMIPECLAHNLSEQQIKKLCRFREWLETTLGDQVKNYRGDCSMSSPYSWKLVATGMGDIIVVEAFGHKCNLMTCDDGELPSDEWIQPAPLA